MFDAQHITVTLQWGLCECVIVHTILPSTPVILWIELGGKPKWLPLNFEYHNGMRTSTISHNVWVGRHFKKTSVDHFSFFFWGGGLRV